MPEKEGLIGRTVLVTGASGFLGRRTVAVLSELGCNVRALIRNTSLTEYLRLPNVTIFHGDVSNADSLVPAFNGTEYVIHAAADTGGTEEGGRRSTIQGTKNILEQSAAFKVKKLVYISSCSVYGVVDDQVGQVVDENAPLENAPEQRGPYSWAKLEAENLVTRFMTQGKIPIVCLRPGTIYGPGGAIFHPMLGYSFGNKLFAIIDNGESILPLVYIDNLVEAIIVSLVNEMSNGQIYNVIDADCVNKRRYMQNLIHQLYPHAMSFYLPYRLLYFLVLLQENMFTVLHRKPVLSCYRLSASQKPVLYNATKIVRELNWKSVVSFEEAVEELIKFERKH